jgi:hypothetical protein
MPNIEEIRPIVRAVERGTYIQIERGHAKIQFFVFRDAENV